MVEQGRHGQACSGQVGRGGDRYGRRGTEGQGVVGFGRVQQARLGKVCSGWVWQVWRG